MTLNRRRLLAGGAGAVGVLALGGGLADYEIDHHPSLRQRIFGCGHTPAIPHSNYTVRTSTTDSKAMKATLPYTVATPADGHVAALVVVLPGLGDDHLSFHTKIGYDGWATAANLPFAFASPGGTDSTYYHPRSDGTDCLAWVTEEFPKVLRTRDDLDQDRSHTGVLGWSMGGFGALLVAQQRPELVSAAVGASPAVFPSYHDAITGHPDTFDSDADWQRYGIWDTAGTISNVAIRVDCGNADPFVSTTRSLMHRIPGATGTITGGCHDAGFWRRNATSELGFLAARLT